MGNAHYGFSLRLNWTLIHSDGVRLIIVLDHRLYGLALSSQIPLFVYQLPLGQCLDGLDDRTWNTHDWPRIGQEGTVERKAIGLMLVTGGAEIGRPP